MPEIKNESAAGAVEAPIPNDKLIDSTKKERIAGNKKRLSIEMPEAFPKEVDLDSTLHDMCDLLEESIIITPEERRMLALWIVHTYCVDAFLHTPRLLFTSPQKGCGKTTAMALTGAMSFKPFHASSLTPAVVFRVIDKDRPTIFADEADTYVYNNEDMRNVFNLGHTKQGAYPRSYFQVQTRE